MKNTPQECAKTSAFTFGACHFRLVHFGSAGATRSFPLALGFCKDYFVINDFEKQLISVVKIQCIPHPFCNMDLPITKHYYSIILFFPCDEQFRANLILECRHHPAWAAC